MQLVSIRLIVLTDSGYSSSRSTCQSLVATSSGRFSRVARGVLMSGLSSFARVCIRLIIARSTSEVQASARLRTSGWGNRSLDPGMPARRARDPASGGAGEGVGVLRRVCRQYSEGAPEWKWSDLFGASQQVPRGSSPSSQANDRGRSMTESLRHFGNAEG